MRALAILLLFGWPVCGLAQISPGELSRPHARLEGLEHCTSCHVLGKEVENGKCLDCHTELAARMQSHAGYHAPLANRRCVECHTEHNGRDFQLVRWDTRKFDHATVGFTLKGKHQALACAQCHRKDLIRAADVLRNSALASGRTYLGLDARCRSCHTDVHRGEFNGKCEQCHTENGWKPASLFSHQNTRYPLTGRHATVACAKCHAPAEGTATTVRFVVARFEMCSSCHGDPHKGKFTQTCQSCHTTDGWQRGAAAKFNHALARFPLKGKHASVPCASCHTAQVTGRADAFHIERFQRCNDCHTSPHAGKFVAFAADRTCESCHTEEGWRMGRAASFDHASTGFALKAAHATLACAKCHVGASTGPARTGMLVSASRMGATIRCDACHSDPHNGQFGSGKEAKDCAACHSEQSYLPSLYSVKDHAETAFPLTGSHLAVSCRDCHQEKRIGGKPVRQFIWQDLPRCAACHRDVHEGEFASVVTQKCEVCHTADSWHAVEYDHSRTRFPLTGGHRTVRCRDCHHVAVPAAATERVWRFTGTPTRCEDCHTNIKTVRQ